MTSLDELIEISMTAREIEHLSDDQLERLWLQFQDDDADSRRIFKAAASAVRTRRIAMAVPLNKMAA